jgi:uncharacterized membrane protein
MRRPISLSVLVVCDLVVAILHLSVRLGFLNSGVRGDEYYSRNVGARVIAGDCIGCDPYFLFPPYLMWMVRLHCCILHMYAVSGAVLRT